LFFDTTKYEEVQQALDESETRFKLIFQRSPDPALLLDGHTFVDCNPAACRVMGCSSKDALLGLGPSHISPKRQPNGALSAPLSRQNIERAMANGSERFEWVFRSFRREPVWADVSLTLVPIGGKEYLYATWRDMSARKKTEEALRDRERQLQAALDASPVAILWSNIKGNVEYVNPRFVQLFGYRLEDIPALTDWFRKAYSTTAHTIPLHTASAMAQIQGSDGLPDSDVTVTCNDGSVRYVSVAAAVVSNDILIMFNDLTARKETEEALRKRERELESKSVNLEETNTALKVLLGRRDEDRRALENTILSNVKELVFPYIDKLKVTHLAENQQTYLGIIESGLKDIVSPFLQKMTGGYARFTPTEIQVANFIRNGKTSKEIGEILNVSRGTVDTHRNSIRNKLGLKNRGMNLRSHLLTLQQQI
jgi:PAS domain S-box-containing protein